MTGLPGSERSARTAAIVAIADRQHGLITGRQLRHDTGSSYKVVHRLRAQGWLQEVLPGADVYAVGSGTPSPWQRAVAAWLAAGPGAVLSHGTAANAHGLPGIARSDHLELTVVAPDRPRIPGIRAHRVRSLDATDVTLHRGIPVTTSVRTLIDLADRLPAPLLERVVDEGIVRRMWDSRTVHDAIERVPRRPGLRPLRELMGARTDWPGADSHLEARVMRALNGLRPFEVHHQVVLDGQVVVLDLAWPEVKVAGECDGWDVRSRSRSKFDHDRRRENLLLAHGWTVAHLTSAMDDHEMVRAVVRLFMAKATGA